MAQTKQQKEMIVLAVLAVVAALVWFAYFGKHGTSVNAFSARGPYTPIDAVNYDPVFKDLSETQNTEYKPTGRNIFVAGPAPVTVSTDDKAKPAPPPYLPQGPQLPPPPPRPVLDWKFFGVGTVPASGPRRAFLLDKEEVHIVSEGDTVENHIRITRIGNDRIEYEDINTGQKNSNNLELPQPPA
ncbi:MAG TPA: hypothetical protein VMH31_10920 [Methylomirabilota bacterium]|nr:hypothetical protein [Methylomirabilota bacterium]